MPFTRKITFFLPVAAISRHQKKKVIFVPPTGNFPPAGQKCWSESVNILFDK